MQPTPEYKILHVCLDKQQTPPIDGYSTSGGYIVFWWKQIPLGQLYVKPGEEIPEEVYHTKLIESVQPAIEVYAAKAPKEDYNWQQALKNRDFERWTSWMEHLFCDWVVNETPYSVPITVIICTRNRADYLKRCLERLQESHCLPEEIIVVDNAPADDSTKRVVAQFEGVRYVQEPIPGLSYARNEGLQKVTKSIVAYIDDDVQVHPEWVYSVWQTFQNKDTAAMTGLVIASELKTEAQQMFEKYWSFNRGYTDKVYDSQYFESTLAMGPPVWEIGAGANMAFRMSVFEEVGMFNVALGAGASGCSEDSELWYRILMNGMSIHYNPRAVVYHEHRREAAGLKKQIFNYMRGFTVAALLQQRLQNQADYKKHMSQVLFPYYARLLKKGFPRYHSRYATVWAEVRGMLSGLVFYKRHKNKLFKFSKK